VWARSIKLSICLPYNYLTLWLFYQIVGPYVVLKLTVLKVAADKLAETALREKMGKTESNIPKWVKRFDNLIGEDRQEKLESEVVPGFVQSKMVKMMPEMMGKKWEEKGMKAEVDVVPEEDQDRYFEKMLRKVRRASLEL
jgi:hypothetical protein